MFRVRAANKGQRMVKLGPIDQLFGGVVYCNHAPGDSGPTLSGRRQLVLWLQYHIALQHTFLIQYIKSCKGPILSNETN